MTITPEQILNKIKSINMSEWFFDDVKEFLRVNPTSNGKDSSYARAAIALMQLWEACNNETANRCSQ